MRPGSVDNHTHMAAVKPIDGSTARSLLVVVCLAAIAACGNRELLADRAALAAAPPELVGKLRADPYNYFRFVNHEWTSRVCDIFAGDLAHRKPRAA